MQAQVQTQSDGTVLLRMNREAARATFASVVFASRYHDGIRDLEAIVKQALEDEMELKDRRRPLCR